jgi:hypothetical protein
MSGFCIYQIYFRIFQKNLSTLLSTKNPAVETAGREYIGTNKNDKRNNGGRITN